MTRARQAVPILIAMLVDSDANVRGAAVSGLSLLTHRMALDGSQWADISTADSANVVHGRWVGGGMLMRTQATFTAWRIAIHFNALNDTLRQLPGKSGYR